MPTIKEQCEKRIVELVPELISWETSHFITKEAQWKYCEEIHLEHILLAIEKVNQGDKTIAVDFNGGISAFIDNDRYEIGNGGVKIKYDLSKSFAVQSEELYTFLLEIIK